MKDFSTFDYTNGSFPTVTATNSSGATLRDGTPITADVVNDIWGAFQAILVQAGVAPSGNIENATDSDLFTALQRTVGQPGEILFWGGSTTTSGLPVLPGGNSARLLELKGQIVLISQYQELFDAVYLSQSTPSFYRCDSPSGTPNPSGLYLQLPDTQGMFIRALSNISAEDEGRLESGDLNVNASVQVESPGDHTHFVQWAPGQYMRQEGWNVIRQDDMASPIYRGLQMYLLDGTVYPDITATTQRSGLISTPDTNVADVETVGPKPTTPATPGANEIRPKNIAFRCMIRF